MATRAANKLVVNEENAEGNGILCARKDYGEEAKIEALSNSPM